MGDVIGDVNSRRGMVIELAERGNMKVPRRPRKNPNLYPPLALALTLTTNLSTLTLTP